ncbi:hypothetical protein BLOT_009872 [Blomia tropicalis]|nr:hypothetical protein BLOT_009872 [Blomia tropicalis]
MYSIFRKSKYAERKSGPFIIYEKINMLKNNQMMEKNKVVVDETFVSYSNISISFDLDLYSSSSSMN